MPKIRVVVESFLLVAITALLSFGFAYLSFERPNEFSHNTQYLLFYIGIDLSFILAILLALKIWKPTIIRSFMPPSFTLIGLALTISICAFVVSDSFEPYTFLKKLYTGKLSFFEPSLPKFDTVLEKYLIFKMVILGPIYEEILYRRILFEKLKEFYPVTTSIIISSILFSIGHLDFNSFLFHFIAGCILAYIYYKTESLLLTIICHSLHNLLVNFTTKKDVSFDDSTFLLCCLFYVACYIGIFLAYKKLKGVKNHAIKDNNP